MVEAYDTVPGGSAVVRLVWAYQFATNGTATAVPAEAVEAALSAQSGWVWLHFVLTDARARHWISEHAPISEPARKALIGSDEHLYLDVVGTEIIGTLPDLHRELAETTEEIARLRFVMTDRVLISARRSPPACGRGDTARHRIGPALLGGDQPHRRNHGSIRRCDFAFGAPLRRAT